MAFMMIIAIAAIKPGCGDQVRELPVKETWNLEMVCLQLHCIVVLYSHRASAQLHFL